MSSLRCCFAVNRVTEEEFIKHITSAFMHTRILADNVVDACHAGWRRRIS